MLAACIATTLVQGTNTMTTFPTMGPFRLTDKHLPLLRNIAASHALPRDETSALAKIGLSLMSQAAKSRAIVGE